MIAALLSKQQQTAAVDLSRSGHPVLQQTSLGRATRSHSLAHAASPGDDEAMDGQQLQQQLEQQQLQQQQQRPLQDALQ